MHKILFTTLPTNDLGLLTRSIPIAKELKKFGYNIAFSSPAKAPDKLIQEAGFKNIVPEHPLYQVNLTDFSLKKILNLFSNKNHGYKHGNRFTFLFKLLRSIPIKFAPSTAEIWNMDHAAAIAGMMNENFIKANCEAYKDLILKCNADLIIDFWNPFVSIAARALNKPIVTVIQADGHPGNNGLIWWKKTPKNLPTALPSINKVLKKYGLETIQKMEELNIGDLTLVVGIPEIDPVPKNSDCIHIGPIIWQNSDSTLPDWFYMIEKGKPLIWVYSGNPRYRNKGTMIDSEVIIHTCINVLPKEILPLPDNFYFADYLPGLLLAEKCDLMIHHGGYGSCQTSLYTGTPSVIIPTFSERESNARRISSIGTGEYILPTSKSKYQKTIDLENFKNKITQVLSNPKYLENAVKYSKRLKSYGGPQKAGELIHQFVRESIF